MKKFYVISFVASATLLSISCQKEGELNREADQTPVSLFAYDASSKTVLNDDWSVDWAEGDKLTVFNAVAGGTAYSDNCRFTISGTPAEGKFTKDTDQADKKLIGDAETYDWYVCYPWMEYGSNPGGTKGYTVITAPKQVGYGSKTHIAGFDLMVGTAKNVSAAETPSVALKHVCTLMKFTVTNNSGEATAITGLTLDATAGGTYITGSFSMDYDNCALSQTMGSSKSYTCALDVVKNTGTEEAPVYEPVDVTVANGESVDLYMVVAPFTIAAGKKIKITIRGGLGDCIIEKTMSSEITFTAGKYNTANVSYTKPEYVVFTETFGANTVTNSNVGSYNKAGLTTAVPGHATSYTYQAAGNVSFQVCSTKNGGINNPNYSGSVLEGAAVKLPNASTAAIYIKSITIEPNTTYVFKYNKSKGVCSETEFDTTTQFKWRKGGTSSWTNLNVTTDVGTISQEFTTGDYTTIDIGIAATAWTAQATPTIYPAIDLFRLIKK